jgi:tetratricopeptide (TPR) repeat protein
MITRTLLLWCSLTLTAAADKPAELFEQAEQLSRSKQKESAMAKVEEAVAAIDRAVVAGEEISWQDHNGLRFAARLAREDFLDYEKSLAFADKLFRMTDTDYWRVPARLERAMTYRAMGDFEKAQQEYDAIADADPRQRTSGIMPQAEMVYFDMDDPQRGRTLIVAALINEAINDRERFNTLRRCAQDAISKGQRDAALQWYGMTEKLPFGKQQERARCLSQAWYEMGRIQESLGRAAEAKVLYRKAMDSEDGEMRYRVRARDALENIEYFE